MNIAKKVAVGTGGLSGFGEGGGELLADEGVKVFALARSVDKVKFPTLVTKVGCNIRALDSIDTAFAQIDGETKEIDFLVNCAGRGLVKSFADTSREEIMDVLGINLKGNIYIAQEVYKRMIPKKSGFIINVGSTSSVKAREMEVMYCASKWGMRGFTESLRMEAKTHGIRVAGVYPGGMMSDNFWSIVPDKDISGYMDPKLIAEQIVGFLKTDKSINPCELVIERP